VDGRWTGLAAVENDHDSSAGLIAELPMTPGGKLLATG
jgi:hypothetical protein